MGLTPRRSAGLQMTSPRSTSRDVDEAHILTMVRRHLEIVEKSFGKQLLHMQEQVDQLQKAARPAESSQLALLDRPIAQADSDVAEARDKYRSLSSQMQLQIRRIDQLEERVWECARIWEARQRFEAVSHKRFSVIERGLEQKSVQADDISQSLINLHTRLTQVEGVVGGERLDSPFQPSAGRPDLPTEVLELRVANAFGKLAYLQQETDDVRTRIEAQEDRVKSLRELVEMKDNVRVKEMNLRMTNLNNNVEERFDTLREEFNEIQDFAQCLPEMVEHIKAIAPRVIEHDRDICGLRQKVQLFEGTVSCEPEQRPAGLVSKVNEHDSCILKLQAEIDSLQRDRFTPCTVACDSEVSGLTLQTPKTDDAGKDAPAVPRLADSPATPDPMTSVVSPLWR